MIEKAIEFIKKCNEKTAIIYDIDGDGISSAAIIAKTINRLFYYMPYAFPMRYNFFSNNKIYNIVTKKKIKNIIILDIAVDEEPKYVLKISKKAKVLVLDHHQVHKDLNKFNILHVNPYFWDKKNSSKYCVSKLAFDICNKIVNIEDLAWLAGLGIINDYCGNYWKKFLNKVYEKYPILKQGKELYSFNSKLGLINHMVTNSYHYAGIDGVKIAYEACLEANSPLDILDAKTAKAKALKYFYEKIQSEINEIVKNWKKYAEIHDNIIFLELKTKFALQSPISTIIGLKNKNRTVIVFRKIGKFYHISIRREDGKINCGELAKFATKNLKEASGGGHCLHPDTLIIMSDGRIIKLKDLDVKCKLKSMNFEKMKIENSECIKKFKNLMRNKLYEIKTTYGFSLISSPEHRVFVLRFSNGEINIAEKKVKDLKIGDFIASVNTIEVKTKVQNAPDVSDVIKKAKKIGHRWKKVTIPKKIDSKIAQLFGYFVGDGYIENNDILELRDKRLEVLKVYKKIIKDIFNCNSSISKIKNKNCWRLRVFSSTIATFMKRLNMQLIEKSPNSVIKGFIKGIFDAEGSIFKNQVEILMIDETLITKIQLLLLRFGIHANKNKHGNCYRLCIRGENLERFKNIGFTAKDKINRLNSSNFKISRIIPIKWDDVRKFIKKKYNKEIYLKREDNRYVSKNELEWVKKRNGNLFSDIEKLFNINWVKIKEIKIKNKITALEDMETTQHNYIANGLIVHNSPASGCRILAKDLSKFKENVLKYLET